MEKITWNDDVRSEVMLHTLKCKGILYIKKKKVNWIGHILCRYYRLKHVIEGKIDRRSDRKTRRTR